MYLKNKISYQKKPKVLFTYAKGTEESEFQSQFEILKRAI